MNTDIAIRVDNLAKRYSIGVTRPCYDTLRDVIAEGVKRPFLRKGRRESATQTYWALKNVSLEIKKGEVVGVIGRNGDFLFIDGDHSQEAVDADLSAWLPKVKSSGIVAMHDIGWAEGVVKGVEKHLTGRICLEERFPKGQVWQNLLICKFLS